MTTNTIGTVFSARLAESIAPALEGMKLSEQVARAAAPHALARTQAFASASAAAVGLKVRNQKLSEQVAKLAAPQVESAQAFSAAAVGLMVRHQER